MPTLELCDLLAASAHKILFTYKNTHIAQKHFQKEKTDALSNYDKSKFSQVYE